MKVYDLALVEVSNFTILAIQERGTSKPSFIVEDTLMPPHENGGILETLEMSGKSFRALLRMNTVTTRVKGKCWIYTSVWSHKWGLDRWIHVIHDDGEICGMNDEHFLNGRKADQATMHLWIDATGYADYFSRVESVMAHGEQTWVLSEDGTIKPASAHSFA